MPKPLHHALLAALLSLSLVTHAAGPAGKVSVFADKNGRWGASDAAGAVVLPFQFDSVRQLEDGYFMVGRSSEKSGQTVFGVFDAQGKEIIPPQFSYIEYLQRFKRFKLTVEAPQYRQGYFDEAGKVVVPVVYDSLERISNMGDEPANIAKRNDKYGYINVLSGKIMIPVEYDALAIDSLMTDAQGNGIAIALKGKKRGVLSTNGQVVVPFEFDAIGDITLSDGAPAERDGKLVQLNFKDGAYTGISEVAPQYSSNFVPRPMASINPAPFDGFYVAEDYPTMKSAWDGWKENRLNWVAIPSIQINGKEAYVSFGLFSQSRLPFMRNVLGVTRKRDGFSLMVDADDSKTKKTVSSAFLTFTAKDGSMVCDKCASWNLPVRWRLLPAEKQQEFGGIGVAIKRLRADAGVTVLEVLASGPAQSAGLKAGDVLMRIDGEPVAQYGMDEVRDRLRGVVGSELRLSVEREGRLLSREIVVKRAAINVR